MVKAEWTGKFPSLCSGVWKLWVDGVDVSDKIPEDLRSSEMNTYGEYAQCWLQPTENGGLEDGFDWEKSGLEKNDWIRENDYWLSTITSDYSVKCLIFDEINQWDWRHGSCGGCI